MVSQKLGFDKYSCYNISGEVMKTIKDDVINEIVINKSRFITLLYSIDDVLKVDKIIEKVKEKYQNATHYCFGYIIDNYKKSSDDNEPSGTAGIPILNVLENNNLNHILAIVVRYFGGIKLGSGGLIRAYSKSVRLALNNTTIVELKKYDQYKITFDYDKVKTIDHIVKNKIISKDFKEDITYTIYFDNINIILPYVKNITKEKTIYVKDS